MAELSFVISYYDYGLTVISVPSLYLTSLQEKPGKPALGLTLNFEFTNRRSVIKQDRERELTSTEE